MIKDPENIAKNITEIVARKSSIFLNSRKFRKLSQSDKLAQIERDRMLNETVMTGLSLAILMFETIADIGTNRSKEQFYRQLSVELMSRYGNWMVELGNPADTSGLLQKFIKARVNEYKDDYREYKKEVGNFNKTNAWIPIVTTGGFFHLTKGNPKADRDQKYFILFRDFIGNLSIDIINCVM